MINRRLIRIKVFKVLYSMVASGSDSLVEAEKALKYSCDKTLHLYYFILNAVSAWLRQNERFTKYCEDHGLVWTEDLALVIRKILTALSEKEYFREYMASQTRSMAEDCALFVRIFSDPELFEDNEELESFLEDMSLFWIDDLGYVLGVIVRNLEILGKRGAMPFPDVFLKDDDREFAYELLRAAVTGYHKYMDIVVANTSNWDPDRVVITDLVMIIQGVAEAVRFSNIPLKVTINEYVDISKFYSTANSRVFVNGLLDRILRKMVDTGEIVKTGRGLIES